MIPPVITRQDAELAEIVGRIERAFVYMNSLTFGSLPHRERSLFFKQIEFMEAYRDVLGERLALVKIRNGL